MLRRHASDARGSRLPSGGSGRQVIGRCCRWLDGAVRQQCAGHLPFERQATPNGGFSILPTGATDPNLTLSVSQEPTLLRRKRTYRLQRVFGYLRS